MILLWITLLLPGCKFFSATQSKAPVIVFTFDDQHPSIYDSAFPIMREFGYRGTNFVNTNALGHPSLMSWAQITELELEYGWETGGHTLNHEVLNQLDLEIAIANIKQDKQNLSDHGLNPRSFALPRGQCPIQLYSMLTQLYQNVRGSSDFAMHHPLNRKALGYLAYQSGWSAEVVKHRILRGIANDEALIIIGFHRFDIDDDSYADSCPSPTFREILRFTHDLGLEVLPLAEAVSQISGT
ncbi:MAG: polysaccharide deacetylase family protein [Candidatus Cloacimonadaceae bacterium]|nr:polysaccharide deacetylase family protein [Candidatus Cloacimonadota bacterium]MDD3533905.1 polysaccharide deacetylase family protein [Candidatus Cloacimonadota bacterium]MDY0127952.1 polysaccharide deacetylase family protein [Candidatus Cloacimonadaceae bacterium]